MVALLGSAQLLTIAAGAAALSINLGQYFPGHLPKPDPPPPAVANPTAQLRSDIAYLARELPRVYAGGTGFHHGSVGEFRAGAAAIEQRLPELDSGHLLVGIMRLLATLRDGETGMTLPPDPPFPIATVWLGDDLRLVGVPADQRDLLGGRILAVNRTPVAIVRARLHEVIPAVTSWEADAKFGTYLRYGRILEGLDITDNAQQATLTVEDVHHQQRELTLTGDYTRGDEPAVMARVPITVTGERPDQPYWWQYLAATNTVYLRYRQCVSGPGFGAVAHQAVAAMRAHDGARLVVDLRGNGGGNSAPFHALISALQRNEGLDQPGRVYGLIDRGTFSSATLNAVELRTQTHALLYGEPTGDPANQWGDQRFLSLTDYLPVHYSTHYFDPARRYHGKPYVSPDVAIPVTLADLLSGLDPVLKAAEAR